MPFCELESLYVKLYIIQAPIWLFCKYYDIIDNYGDTLRHRLLHPSHSTIEQGIQSIIFYLGGFLKWEQNMFICFPKAKAQ